MISGLDNLLVRGWQTEPSSLRWNQKGRQCDRQFDPESKVDIDKPGLISLAKTEGIPIKRACSTNQNEKKKLEYIQLGN